MRSKYRVSIDFYISLNYLDIDVVLTKRISIVREINV